MSVTYDDALSAIVAYLQTSGTTLYDYCGTNVFKRVLPSSPDFKNDYAAVVCINSGETPYFTATLIDWTFHARCYGGSSNPDAAANVHRALRAILHSARCVAIGNITLVIVREENATEAIEPDTDFPVVNAMFRVLSAF